MAAAIYMQKVGVTWVECQNIWLYEWWPGMIIAFNGLDISDEVGIYYLINDRKGNKHNRRPT